MGLPYEHKQDPPAHVTSPLRIDPLSAPCPAAAISELDGNALALEIALEVGHEVELLVDRQAADDRLEHRPDGDVVLSDDTAVVDVCEDAHEEPRRRAASATIPHTPK